MYCVYVPAECLTKVKHILAVQEKNMKKEFVFNRPRLIYDRSGIMSAIKMENVTTVSNNTCTSFSLTYNIWDANLYQSLLSNDLILD